jgi:hypothetical protein
MYTAQTAPPTFALFSMDGCYQKLGVVMNFHILLQRKSKDSLFEYQLFCFLVSSAINETASPVYDYVAWVYTEYNARAQLSSCYYVIT